MDKFSFRFNAEVHGSDKQLGHLAKVVINPETWQLTNLIIESGFLFKRAKVIPITKVEGAAAQAIYLAVNNSDLNDYPDYQEIVVEKGAPEWQRPLTNPDIQIPEPRYSLVGVPEMPVVQEKVRTGVSDELVLLDNNIPVSGLEGHIGHLNCIITAENFQIGQFVVTQGKLLPKQILIPINLIEKISEYGIHILATNDEIGEFPEFVTLNDETMRSVGGMQ
ncbi:MAG: hypothetical protein IAE79_09925 [Anaerolinea sp.]|nr:hypothetical protein [Anaerolinea sp.]